MNRLSIAPVGRLSWRHCMWVINTRLHIHVQGECDEPSGTNLCPAGSDSADCQSSGGGSSCRYANDVRARDLHERRASVRRSLVCTLCAMPTTTVFNLRRGSVMSLRAQAYVLPVRTPLIVLATVVAMPTTCVHRWVYRHHHVTLTAVCTVIL